MSTTGAKAKWCWTYKSIENTCLKLCPSFQTTFMVITENGRNRMWLILLITMLFHQCSSSSPLAHSTVKFGAGTQFKWRLTSSLYSPSCSLKKNVRFPSEWRIDRWRTLSVFPLKHPVQPRNTNMAEHGPKPISSGVSGINAAKSHSAVKRKKLFQNTLWFFISKHCLCRVSLKE